MKKASNRLFILVTFFTAAMGFSGCATNPVTGKKELQLVSESQEINIGKENYLPSQQSQGGAYNVEPQLTDYVAGIGGKLASVSDRPNLPFYFVVLNNSVPNAWALPGGKIAVNRGLLLELKNEAELAAVLGHEIIHAAARHGAQSMERGILLSVGVAGIAVAAGDKDFSQLAVGTAALGGQLITTKYSRSAELEADHFGMKYMAKAGYDSSAAIGFQQTFVKLSQGQKSNWLEGLFASHPPSQERVEANRRTAKELTVKGRFAEKEYQNHIAPPIKSKPAYEAMNEARKALKDGDSDNALSLIDHAIRIEPREALFYGVKGDIYLKKNQLDKSEDLYGKALEKNDQFFLFYLQRGSAREKLSKLNGAKTDLNKSIELLPTSPAYYTLGDIALKENDNKSAKEYYAKAASNESDLGKKAAMAFTKLDINDNPQKYLTITFFKTAAGKLALEIKNQSQLSLKDIQIDAKLLTINGNLIARESLQSPLILRPGENKQLISLAITTPDNLQTQKLVTDITKVSIVE